MSVSENPQLDTELQSLIEQIQDPANQGEPLVARDYLLLAAVCVAIPVLLIVFGMALS
ncbi:hypothetical protein RD149_06460 [Gordonia westfalica]|uniref:Uncharacterized protein n=1 Tax=Gordonia westfalica TaxID=158898 RepID=A0A1H2KXY8_9ACTN|nr:hypothetical protein [Gordonia westfalica]MDS1113406.1 hypothetical protein [Gordonia westfalica]SDU73248.1 hypothetical protein SAMN04488548_1343925 [Gordonia westfalica]